MHAQSSRPFPHGSHLYHLRVTIRYFSACIGLLQPNSPHAFWLQFVMQQNVVEPPSAYERAQVSNQAVGRILPTYSLSPTVNRVFPSGSDLQIFLLPTLKPMGQFRTPVLSSGGRAQAREDRHHRASMRGRCGFVTANCSAPPFICRGLRWGHSQPWYFDKALTDDRDVRSAEAIARESSFASRRLSEPSLISLCGHRYRVGAGNAEEWVVVDRQGTIFAALFWNDLSLTITPLLCFQAHCYP